MTLPFRLPAGWTRLPPRTLRLRLTLVYGGLFLVLGAALLAITYALVAHYTSGDAIFVKGPAKIRTLMVGVPDGPLATVDITKQAMAAQATAQRSQLLHQLLVQSGIALGLMAFASIGLGWAVAGRALRPLRTMTSAAREISATSLHRRLALAGPDDELKQLGDTFDELLGRLEAAFAAQRQFVANASHELRTPLTLVRALIEVALADPRADAAALRQTCEQVLAAGEQQERLIEALLTLSRSQRGLDRREPVDLAEIAEETLRSAAVGDLRVDARLSPAHTRGDTRLVERLVANLVDNAVRHNLPARGLLEVATRGNGDGAVLTVANSGPIVPAGEVDRLFEPFQRLDGDRAGHRDGLGLGLSIVSAIAAAHGAALTAGPRPGGGLHVEVAFPA